MAVAWLKATSNHKIRLIAEVYTNTELPQAELPSQLSSQLRASLLPAP
jgi:hypothetical protein